MKIINVADILRKLEENGVSHFYFTNERDELSRPHYSTVDRDLNLSSQNIATTIDELISLYSTEGMEIIRAVLDGGALISYNEIIGDEKVKSLMGYETINNKTDEHVFRF